MKAMASTKSELAIPFISFTSGGGFTLNPQAEQFLRELPEQKKVAAISIVGKYRTGKSFFVNRVLLGTKKSGFQVGPTINPCTKGLWIWKKSLSAADPDLETILIDTEGFGGMDENANHDNRIFLFSLLLSSYFIYNSTGSIDQNAINTLNLVINLAKEMQAKSGRSSEDNSHFPAFLWVVRDFTLRLVDKQGQQLTSKQYLQSALELQKGVSQAIQNKNKIRRLFKRFFQDRDCITMIRPVEDEKLLQRLDELDNTMLRPEFVAQVESAKTKIFNKVKPKSINGKLLTGCMFVELIKGYIDIINKGSIPTVQSAWVYVCRSQGLKAVQQAVKNIEKKLDELLSNKLIQQSQIEHLKQELFQEVVKNFKKKSMGSEQGNPDLLENLEKRFNLAFSTFAERNQQGWTTHYRENADQAIDQLKQKLFRDQYENYNDFLQDFNQLKEKYEKQTGGGGGDKWSYFNEASEAVHRLAGETITNKINQALQQEKQLLQEKISLRETEYKERKEEMNEERNKLRQRVEDLQRQLSRAAGAQASTQQRLKDLKHERDHLQERCHRLQLNIQQKSIQVERLTSEFSQVNNLQLEQTRSQLKILKSNIEKDKVIWQLQKSYHQKDIQTYKQKVSNLEAECRKLKSLNNQKEEECQRIRSQLNEQQQKIDESTQLQEVYQKKIESLTVQNNRKAEMMNEHNDWVLEKSYLENQVTFLKNTLNQNKRLHDALLVALQQSVNTNEADSNNELVQTNKNLSSAMEKLEARCRLLEEKSEKLKKFKNIVKNCVALQCLHCSKWIANTTFPQHLAACSESSMTKHIQRLNTKENPVDSSGLHITISQTLIKEIEENKPFTQYYIQVSLHNKKWTVTRKYKNFCELQQSLVSMFPGLKFPESASAIINVHTDINQIINSKRTVAVEERRKALQQFMRDLSKIDEVRNSRPFRDFIKLDENMQVQGEIFTSSLHRTQIKRVAASNMALESPDIMKKQSSGMKPYGSRSKFK